jgi:hypothetical protein
MGKNFVSFVCLAKRTGKNESERHEKKDRKKKKKSFFLFHVDDLTITQLCNHVFVLIFFCLHQFFNFFTLFLRFLVQTGETASVFVDNDLRVLVPSCFRAVSWV